MWNTSSLAECPIRVEQEDKEGTPTNTAGNASFNLIPASTLLEQKNPKSMAKLYNTGTNSAPVPND